MSQILLTIPDAVVQRVLDAYAALYRWDGVTPATKAAFAKRCIIAEVISVVKRHEAELAVRAADQLAREAVDADLIIS